MLSSEDWARKGVFAHEISLIKSKDVENKEVLLSYFENVLKEIESKIK